MFTFIWAKSEKWSFLTLTFGCRNLLLFVNRGSILPTVCHRSVIYDPTDICIHSLKHLRDIYGHIFNLKMVKICVNFAMHI